MPLFSYICRPIVLLAWMLFGVVVAGAKGPIERPRIGFMIGTGYQQNISVFRAEMERLGYLDGKNVDIFVRESRSGDESAFHAAELSALRVQLIVVAALQIALTVRATDPQMPMVIVTAPGLVSNGFAKSHRHPGGIATGLDELPPGITERRLKLLKLAAPKVKRVALLSTTPGIGGHATQLADATRAANAMGIGVKAYRATSVRELKHALDSIRKDGMDSLLSFQGGLALSNRKLIVDFAAKHRLPAIYQATLFVESGGLMAWAPDLKEQFRSSARMVGDILKGAEPGDLPITFPTTYRLTVNARTAKALGLTLTPALMSQAPRVLR